MDASQQRFSDFWQEIRWPLAKGAIRTVLGSFVVFPLGALALRWMQCKGWYSPVGGAQNSACADLVYPLLYGLRLLLQLPLLFLATLPPLLAVILFLEWLKYKEDKAPGVGGYYGWTVPSPSWVRLNLQRLVDGSAWSTHTALRFEKVSESEGLVRGSWTDEALGRAVKGISRRFTSFLRKPVRRASGLIEWHFLVTNGDEFRLRFERLQSSQEWQLTASLYGWVGRRKPARKIQVHTTRIVLAP